MRHLVITQSMYGPQVPIEWNRLRLGMAEGISAPSLRAQSTRDFSWLVTLHPNDPLLEARRAAFESADVECVFVYFDPDTQRRPGKPEGLVNPQVPDEAVENWRQVQWRMDRLLLPVLAEMGGPLLLTRLDDDDAFAASAFERLHAAVGDDEEPEPTVWSFPMGWIIWTGEPAEAQPFRHPLLGFTSFHVPAGSRVQPFTWGHNRVADHLPVRVVDEEEAWAVFRHHDNMSRLSRRHARRAGHTPGVGGAAGVDLWFGKPSPLGDAVGQMRALFPAVAWDRFAEEPL